MKTNPALLLLAFPLAASLAADNPSAGPAPAASVAASSKLTPGSILAAQIREIAATKDLTPAAKRRQIASAVKLAVTTAVTNVKDPQQAFDLILEITTESAKAVPEYANVITDSAVGVTLRLPALSGRTDLAGKLRDAVSTALDQTGEGAATPGTKAAEKTSTPSQEFTGKTDDVIVSPSH